VKSDACPEIFVPPQRRLKAFCSMPVGEHLRPVAIKNEKIGVPPVCERGIRAAPEGLTRRGEPGTSTLPRVIVAIKLLGAEGPIIGSEDDCR
jgi:hypothetical protein